MRSLGLQRSMTIAQQPKFNSNHDNSQKTPKRKNTKSKIDQSEFSSTNKINSSDQPEAESSTKEILSDMHVLNSLKKQAIFGASLASEEPQSPKSQLKMGQGIVGAGGFSSYQMQQLMPTINADHNADRLMQMVDQKFSKFEDIFT